MGFGTTFSASVLAHALLQLVDMGALESLLRRLGYVKLSRFDLVLTADGQLLSRTTGKRVDGGELDFAGPLPCAVSLPAFAAPILPPPAPIGRPDIPTASKAPPPIPTRARRRPASPRAPSPVIAVLPLSPPPSTGPFERAPDPESVEWQRKLVEARSRAQRDEEREWELAMARARAAAEAAPAPAPASEPASEPDEEREWELAMARARAAAEAAPSPPPALARASAPAPARSPAAPAPAAPAPARSPAPTTRLARGTAPPAAATRGVGGRPAVRGPGAPPSARTDTPSQTHVGRAPRTRSTAAARLPRAGARAPLRPGA